MSSSSSKKNTSKLRIGLTGGIGSGKSTVANIIKALGYPVYISDSRASHLMNTHIVIRQKLINLFGKDIYTSVGKLNKPHLATIIFNNTVAIQQVNHIVHPIVMQDFEQWCLLQRTNILFFESAILFEAELTHHFDKILSVHADLETRIYRVIARDQCTQEQVIKRIHNQSDDIYRQTHSDYLIHNQDGDMLLPQIIAILKELDQLKAALP